VEESQIDLDGSDNAADLASLKDEFDEFLRAVSHDLRAPLRRIRQFTAVLLEEYAGIIGDEGKRILDLISGNVKNMEGLVDALSVLSRLGRQEMHNAEVHMDRLAQSVFDELAGKAAGRSISFTLGEMPVSYCDGRLMREVYLRLFENAFKFTSFRDRAVIEAGGNISGSELVYYVKDNGAGFETQYAHKLFRLFQRLHGPGEYAGAGTGLAAVKLIIRRHHGRVWAEGAPGAGAAFYFTLPAGHLTERDI
jgi:two-component system sensor kinase